MRAGLRPLRKSLTKDPRTNSSGFFMRFMKPIPTTYEGVKFRSRLEARWAVFFCQLQIDWRYEPFEIGNENLSYTPDFLLHNLFLCFFNKRVFVEIKPLEPNDEYIEYLKKVKDPEGEDIFVFFGEPNFGVKNAIRVFSNGPNEERIVTSERGVIMICQGCGWFKWKSEDGHWRSKTCECGIRIFKPECDVRRAYNFSSQYRFDLKLTDNGIWNP